MQGVCEESAMEGSGIMTNVEGAARDLGPGAEQSERFSLFGWELGSSSNRKARAITKVASRGQLRKTRCDGHGEYRNGSAGLGRPSFLTGMGASLILDS
jgi:hypothetical protein